jgi:hypothetical protein
MQNDWYRNCLLSVAGLVCLASPLIAQQNPNGFDAKFVEELRTEIQKVESIRSIRPHLPKKEETPFWTRSLSHLIVPVVLAIISALLAVLTWIFRKTIGSGGAPPNLLEQERIKSNNVAEKGSEHTT